MSYFKSQDYKDMLKYSKVRQISVTYKKMFHNWVISVLLPVLNFRIPLLQIWEFVPSGLWSSHVERVVPDISEVRNVFIFKISQFLDCMTLKVKALWSFETAASTHLRTQRHVPDGLNLQRHRSEKLRSSLLLICFILYSHFMFLV